MRVVALLAAAFLVAGCAVGGTKTSTETTTLTVTRTVTTAATPTPAKGALAETENARYFGAPVSITKLDATRYALVLEPQFFLVGVTANVLFNAAQQNACQPLECSSPPDDRYVIPAGARNLLFVLPASAKGAVLTMDGGKMKSTTLLAPQLAALVNGAKTPQLVEPLDSGLWLTVDVDTVTSFAQQFQP